MWMVEYDLRIREIVAIYDTQFNKLITYTYKDDFDEDTGEPDEWYRLSKGETIHETKLEAEAYKAELLNTIKAKCAEVKNAIDDLDSYAENDELKISREDFLPSWCSSSWYRDNYDKMDNKYRIMKTYVTCGMLNINAESFRADEVIRIEWNQVRYMEKGKERTKETATIILKNDHRVETRTEVEYEIVELLFGENRSEQIYSK